MDKPPTEQAKAAEFELAPEELPPEEIPSDEMEPRSLVGRATKIVFAIALLLALFQLWTGWRGPQPNMIQRAIHLGFVFTLVFLLYPPVRRIERRQMWRGDAWQLAVGFAASIGLVMLAAEVARLLSGSKTPLLPEGVQVLLGAGLALALYLPIRQRMTRDRILPLDFLLLGLGIAVNAYMVVNYDRIIENPTDSTALDRVLGVITVILVMEATRRTVGWVFPAVSVFFLLYAYFGKWFPGMWGHPGFAISTIVETLYMTTSGIYGVITGISATIVALFILFGSLVFYTGGGATYVDLALKLVGRAKGGPAKVSSISSALFGTISGSAVANVVVDGVFNIPLMKSLGYRKTFACAVEATASTGGQIVPPIMGAGAFIMAELLSIPYLTIAASATIPALLYYTGTFMSTHYEAIRGGLARTPEERIPRLEALLRWHKLGPLFIPVFVLLFLMMIGYDPTTAVFYTTAAAVILFVFSVGRAYLAAIPAAIMVGLFLVPQFNPATATTLTPTNITLVLLLTAVMVFLAARGSFQVFLERAKGMVLGLESGARSIVLVACICANAQIVIGMVGLTGLGVKFSDIIITMAGANLLLALIFAGAVVLVLGMGVPTTAAYVLGASVVGPALIKLGVAPLVAHMFIFYFAIISAITPPVCAAVYVAAALGRAPWLPTAGHAVRLGLGGFIAPFMFVYAPELMFMTPGPDAAPLSANPILVVERAVMAVLGITSLSAAAMNCLVRPLNILERLLLFAAAGLLIVPEFWADAVGLPLMAGVYVWQKFVRPTKVAVEVPATSGRSGSS